MVVVRWCCVHGIQREHWFRISTEAVVCCFSLWFSYSYSIGCNSYLIKLKYPMSIGVLRRSFIYSCIVLRVWHASQQRTISAVAARQPHWSITCWATQLYIVFFLLRLGASLIESPWTEWTEKSSSSNNQTKSNTCNKLQNEEIRRIGTTEMSMTATTLHAIVFHINLKCLNSIFVWKCRTDDLRDAQKSAT